MIKRSAMWNEIQEQPAVMRKILIEYISKAEYFKEILLSKKQIILTGTGASLYACYMAKFLFFKYAHVLPQIVAADELKYLLHAVDRDVLIIFVSQSGESYETKLVGSMLKERGIDFWGITNEVNSSLAGNASEVLLLHSGTEISSATKTNMASFLLLTIMAGGYDSAVKNLLLQLPEQLEKDLKMAESKIENIAEHMMQKINMYILALGANVGTAIEGALMMKEKTFIHTSGSSVSDFRHGAVEVIEPGLPILLIAVGEKACEELMKHASYFLKCKCSVYAIMDIRVEACPLKEENIIFVPKCEIEELSPILTLIPLQLLAEKIAEKKGLDIDGFRYLSKVVSQYEGEG